MIEMNIPGRGTIQIEHLVCDVNGTLAVDGILGDGLARIIYNLSDRIKIHIISAATHGRQDEIERQLGLRAVRIQPGDEAAQKANFVAGLGPEYVMAIGQGANDALMLRKAAIGICILSDEGTAIEALTAADVVVKDIFSAFALLENPLRLVATLRK